MLRALLFAGTGVAWFVFWLVTGPSEDTASMMEWPRVIWFSATLLVLAVALVMFGRMVGGRWVIRLATVAAAGVTLSSVANIIEDGFRVEAAFWGFILGTLTLDLALAALTIAIVRVEAGRQKLLAAVPAATLAGVLLFPPVGGPLMLGAWLVAAAAAVALVARPVGPVLPSPRSSG